MNFFLYFKSSPLYKPLFVKI